MTKKNLSLFVGVVLCLTFAFSQVVFGEENRLKALIIDGQNNHPWAEVTPVLKEELEQSGRFTVDVATSPAEGQDMSGFKPEFDKYDVLVMNYTGDSWSEETKAAFEKYVREGGGLVIVHAANNAFPDWKEYNQMIAVGGWGNRNEKSGPYLYWEEGKVVRNPEPGHGGGHGPQWKFLVEVRDTEHPITKGLPLQFRHCEDELYERLRGPAENVKILATAYADPKQKGSGRHEPMLMVIDYGKGRVFHHAMGHAGRQCKSVAFIAPFLRGTEWAATGEVTIPVPSDMPNEKRPKIRD
ncbi:MAG: ThuA domain-containing protein [Thermoguttaceae bacterium]